MLKAVLFDLDGTLLPMDEEKFTNGYFELLSSYLEKVGYEKQRLISTVWACTKRMIKNNGEFFNEEVFWKEFFSVYGEGKLKDKAQFDDFYKTDFEKTVKFCGFNPLARETVVFARSLAIKTVLASNPLFPRGAMLTRAGFVGLKEQDFDYVSNYSNSSFCKPNPLFYKQILDKMQLNTDEVIYFGNSEKEDYIPATSIGVKCYLVGENVTAFEKIKDVILREQRERQSK